MNKDGKIKSHTSWLKEMGRKLPPLTHTVNNDPKWSSTLWCVVAQVGQNCHFSDCWPPTSDDHNFFIRTPFQVFLNSMEIPLNQDSIHVPVEDSR